MISFIVTAAGESSRFGSPKALVTWNGQPLINHILYELISAKIYEVIVVLGSQAAMIEPYVLKHAKIKLVYNKNYKFGQTTSIQCGLQHVSSSAIGIGLLPIDFPRISTALIDRLLDAFVVDRPKILIPTFNHRKGHPPIMSHVLNSEILALSNDVGVNSVWNRYQKDVCLYPVNDPAVLMSFNTPEELAQIRHSLT